MPWRLGRAAAERIPGARFELIRGAGHVPYLSHAAIFNRLLAGFLDRLT